MATYAPDLGDNDLSALTRQLVEDTSVSPDVSRVIARVGGQLRVDIIDKTSGVWRTRLGVLAGAGAVYTEDDLVGRATSDEWKATATQFHPEWSMALCADASRGSWGIRTRIERQSYTEVFTTTVRRPRNLVWVGVGLTYSPPLPEARGAAETLEPS